MGRLGRRDKPFILHSPAPFSIFEDTGEYVYE